MDPIKKKPIPVTNVSKKQISDINTTVLNIAENTTVNDNNKHNFFDFMSEFNVLAKKYNIDKQQLMNMI